MGFGGGGSTGTTTTVQNNTPFNAGNLTNVENQAIDMQANNPLTYYPAATYQPPDPNQYAALGGTINYGINAGNATTNQMLADGTQSVAIDRASNLANGAGLNGAQGWLGGLTQLGNTNPASQGQASLSDFTNGGYLQGAAPLISGLVNNVANGPAASTLQNTSGVLSDLALAGPAANSLQNSAANLSNVASNGTALANLSNIGNNLSNLANNGNAVNQLSNIGNGLSSLANTGPAANSLAATANGQFLGANPYLDSQFGAASNALKNAFMTATAPQTDSAMEAAGRYGSGILSNSQGVNQQAYGKSLADLASSIYGTDYTNERQLMNNAATNLGNLQTGALSAAGNTASNLAGAQTNALSAAGNQANNYGSLQTNAFNAAGNQASNLGSLQATALNAAANASANQGNLQNSAYANAGNLYGTQTGQVQQAASNMGNIGVSAANAQTNAYNSALNNYGNLLTGQQTAINSIPALTSMPLSDYQAAYNGGQGFQQLGQQNINDLVSRYYGMQQAPWQTLDNAAAIVGGAIPGSTSITQPYFTNPMGSAIQGLTGAATLGTTLFGSGASGAGAGLLGGLIGK